MSNYSELLKDPRWQKKRLEIFQRDEWTCQHCRKTDKTLNAHHIKYSGSPWEVDDAFLITLCEKCHDVEERYLSSNPDLKAIAEFTGLTAGHIFDLVFTVALEHQPGSVLKAVRDIVRARSKETEAAIKNRLNG